MALVNGEIADAEDVNAEFDNIVNVPVGAVIAWFDSIPGVPSLPTNFVQCDGQVLDDDASPLDGQTMPDLNGDNKFLRGNSTAGGEGGEDTHTLTEAEMPAHTHSLDLYHNAGSDTSGKPSNYGTDTPTTDGITGSAGSGDAHENKPPYTNVVWIMRVR